MDNDEIGVEDLERTIQHQAETIEALHLASSKYKNRLEVVESKLLEREAELESFKVLSQENGMLRSEVLDLRSALKTLEQSTARIIDKNTLGTETHAQLGVRVQAYQRHNAYLQGELSVRDARIRSLEDKIDFLNEENQTKDRRMLIMQEKLRQHNIDPSSTVASVRVPEETLSMMKVKLTSQTSTIELLHERVENMLDESERKKALIEALQKENKALRVSVQKLIAQVMLQSSPISEEPVEDENASGGGRVGQPIPTGGSTKDVKINGAAVNVTRSNLNSRAFDESSSLTGGWPKSQVGGGGGAQDSFATTIEQRIAAFRQRNPQLN